MKLHDIIILTEERSEEVPFHAIAPYKKLLYTYYKETAGEEPVLIVTCITNAVQLCKIAHESTLHDAFDEIRGELEDAAVEDEDIEAEMETIAANSMLMNQIL